MTRSEIIARADELVDRDRAVHTGTGDYPEGAVRIAARWILTRVAGLNADNEARAVSSIPDETRERALSLAGDAVRKGYGDVLDEGVALFVPKTDSEPVSEPGPGSISATLHRVRPDQGVELGEAAGENEE